MRKYDLKSYDLSTPVLPWRSGGCGLTALHPHGLAKFANVYSEPMEKITTWDTGIKR